MFQVIDLENLQFYNSLIQQEIKTIDSHSLKTVVVDGNFLKFYKSDSGSPAFQVELPDTDVEDFIHKIQNAQSGNIVIVTDDGGIADSGLSFDDFALKQDIEDAIEHADDLFEVYGNVGEDIKLLKYDIRDLKLIISENGILYNTAQNAEMIAKENSILIKSLDKRVSEMEKNPSHEAIPREVIMALFDQ